MYGAPMSSTTDQLLTVDQVRSVLNVSKSKLWAMLADQTIVSVKLGGRRLVRSSDLDDFIRGLK